MKGKYFEILTQRKNLKLERMINLQKSWKNYRITFWKRKII